jgi:hypothetical protein
MLRVNFRRIKPGKEAQLRAWLTELSERSDEVRATFVHETVRHEQAFVLQTVDGPILVYAVEAVDHDRGRDAFARSKHAIDEQHKKVMGECLGARVEVQPLYDVALDDSTRDDS